MSDDDCDLEAKFEIVIPYVLRGLIIHLMNDSFDMENYYSEL